MIRTFKYRIRPTKQQENRLNAMLSDMTWLYNYMLDARIKQYKETGKSDGFYEQSRLLTQIKKDNRLSIWPSQSLQMCIRRLDLAYQAFFRRIKSGETAGFPRFKGSRGVRSVSMNNGTSCLYGSTDSGRGNLNRSRTRNVSETTVTVYIQGIGHIKVIEDRPMPNAPKTMTISRGRQGKWFLSCTVEVDQGIASNPTQSQEAGIDLGKTKFISTSDGDEYLNPRFLNQTLPKLKDAQSKYSKLKHKNKGKRTRRVRELGKVVGDLHEKVENQRLDYHHKVANDLIKKHQIIYVEDLSVKQIIESTNKENFRRKAKNRNTYDVAWGQFISILTHKAESAGRQVVLVDPAYTSQRCNKCGHIERGNRKWSAFECLSCHHQDDADMNAAKNILDRGQGMTFRGYRDFIIDEMGANDGKSELVSSETVAFMRPE